VLDDAKIILHLSSKLNTFISHSPHPPRSVSPSGAGCRDDAKIILHLSSKLNASIFSHSWHPPRYVSPSGAGAGMMLNHIAFEFNTFIFPIPGTRPAPFHQAGRVLGRC